MLSFPVFGWQQQAMRAYVESIGEQFRHFGWSYEQFREEYDRLIVFESDCTRSVDSHSSIGMLTPVLDRVQRLQTVTAVGTSEQDFGTLCVALNRCWARMCMNRIRLQSASKIVDRHSAYSTSRNDKRLLNDIERKVRLSIIL